MNKAQKRAIEQAIANLEDNLFRYKFAEQQHPGSKTGNGAPYTEVIEEHKRQIAELKEPA